MPVVVVTGASQGIGAAIADMFADAYAAEVKLALVARSKGKLEQVAGRCRDFGARAEVFPCDVADEEAVNVMARQVQDRFGTADVLVNNAGIFVPGSFLETGIEQFRDELNINLTSTFLVTRAFLNGMLERGSGDVFFMASVASIQGYPGGFTYCVAKHGLLGLARALREETKERGIRVMALLPGATRTASWDGTELPDERFIDAKDIAKAVLDAHRLSERAVVEEILIRPQLGDI
ncbi:MAG: SDR family oxidoreductase [Rubricoccaceae bacterium]|nr:SDR family oxidoreductase [Rubricoccaceae bacterium]